MPVIEKRAAIFDLYKIVPLGCECITRDIFLRGCFMPKENCGVQMTPYGPYDGCVNADVDGIIYTLNTDFKEYFNNLSTIDPRTDARLTVNFVKSFPECKSMFFNNSLQIAYVHDSGESKKDLINMYKTKIENFRQIITCGTHIVFSIACLGASRSYEGTLLDKNHCLITSDQIRGLSDVLDKICAAKHSLIVFAPGAEISSDRNDVLILKKHFGNKRYWRMLLDVNMRENYGGTFSAIESFICRRLKKPGLNERSAKVDVSET